MSDLLVIEFPTEAEAEELRQRVLGMQKEYLIELGDAVVAIKRPDGSIKLNQLVEPVRAGAVSGMFWGTLVGLLFMMPFAGAAVGAASGALRGKFTDIGISNDFMRDVSGALQSGNAALFLLIRKMTTDKVTWLRTSLSHETPGSRSGNLWHFMRVWQWLVMSCSSRRVSANPRSNSSTAPRSNAGRSSSRHAGRVALSARYAAAGSIVW